MSTNKSRKYLKILKKRNFFLVIILLIFLVGTSAVLYSQEQGQILRGVTIAGINVGNLTKEEAKKIVDPEVNRLLNQTIKVKVEDQALEVSLKDLGLSLNADLAIQEALDVGREGLNVFSKLFSYKNVNIDFTRVWDELTIKETLNKNLAVFNDPARDASFTITKDNRMLIESEHVGLVIDSEALIKEIKEINIYEPIPEIKAEFIKQIPTITAAQLEEQKITGLLASYTTRFDPNQTARSGNVRIAAKALDMAIIKPGGTISFNQIVGERTAEAGYKDAYIIVNGEFVPGLAGGICQVSSTLYNTGLLANLTVTERRNHDLAVSYVPLGQDATVAYPDLDLKFINNTGGYLLIRTWTSNNSITIEMYGKVKAGQEVFIKNTIQSVIPAAEQRLVDETMAPGTSVLKQQGQPGYIVNSVRTVKVNGVTVSSEPLKQSRYSPLPKIYAVGQ